MFVDSVKTFAAILKRYHLLDSPQLAQTAGPLAATFPNPKSLAGELIRRGWLSPFQVNQIFQGRAADLLLESYVLLERLGEGGMGQVFKARNWKLNRLVALKLIRNERLNNAEVARRFQREVRAAAQLNHPNVVHAYDCGESGDRHFYVMEYVDGIDLAQLVRRDGPLGVDLACDCIRQAALGLQHAYERGLVHRDIKPHNLLLTRGSDGCSLVKILDMGLARLDQASELDSGTMTREGVVMGTLDYIAPEQARNAHLADTRADLYSLGCTLYYLLAAQPPFPGGTATEKLLKHQIDTPPSIQSLRPDVPASLNTVLQRLLAKRPEQRYQSPAELAVALTGVPASAIPANRQRQLPGDVVDFYLTSDPAGWGTYNPAADAAGSPSDAALEDTVAGWSSIVEAPMVSPASAIRRRRAAQRQIVLWWWGVVGGLALLALISLLLALL